MTQVPQFLTASREGSRALLDQDLRVLLDHAPDAIGRFDRQLRHVYVNRATAEANKRPVSDFFGCTMEDLGHAPEVCELINTHLRRVFAEGVEHRFEMLFEGPHGPAWYQCRMAPEFGEDGGVQYVLVISRDISEAKRAEIALRESERKLVKGEVASMLAHQIHNPLSAVVNVMYLLKANDSLDSSAREFLAMAERELSRVVETSQRLLLLDPGLRDSNETPT